MADALLSGAACALDCLRVADERLLLFRLGISEIVAQIAALEDRLRQACRVATYPRSAGTSEPKNSVFTYAPPPAPSNETWGKNIDSTMPISA